MEIEKFDIMVKSTEEESPNWTEGCVEPHKCSDCDGICPMNYNKELRDKFEEWVKDEC